MTTQYVLKARVKGRAKEAELMVSRDVYDPLNCLMDAVLGAAMKAVKEDGRKIIKSQDIVDVLVGMDNGDLIPYPKEGEIPEEPQEGGDESSEDKKEDEGGEAGAVQEPAGDGGQDGEDVRVPDEDRPAEASSEDSGDKE